MVFRLNRFIMQEPPWVDHTGTLHFEGFLPVIGQLIQCH